MNDNEREFENFVREIKFDDTPDSGHRDKLEQELLSTIAKQPRQKSQPLRIWRTIMKSRIRKLVAAVVVIAALIGVYQFAGGRAAFGQMTEAVRTSLARLKEFVLETRTQEAAPPPPLRPVRDVDTSKWSDIIQYNLFLVQGRQADLRNFFEKQDIEFTPTTNNPNICYAILDGDKADGFIAFSQSSDELKLLATPRLILRDGKEAMLGSADLAGRGGLAFAVAGTLVDDNKHIDLSFSFYDGETGIEIPSIRIKTGEAVLIRAVKTATATGDDDSNEENAKKGNDIFILIRIKVLSPT
jgi:hypothetical protein